MTYAVRAAALATAVMLAGCYESNSMLLDASQARQPISTYQDWTYSHSDGGRYHARLNPRSDGWYEYDEASVDKDGKEGKWNHHTVLLNYLENTAGFDVYVSGTWDDDEHAYVYGIVAVEPGGRWQSFSPNCDVTADNEQNYKLDTDAAKSAGAQLKTSDIEDVCEFATAGSLFAAMRTVAGDPGFRNRVDEAAK